MSYSKQDLLRKIPAVEAVLEDEDLRGRTADVPRPVVVDAVRTAIDQVRAMLMEQAADGLHDPDELRRAIVAGAERNIAAAVGPYYRRAINATGIILHTALGRAVLPRAAMRQINEELAGYSVLQMDLATGLRAKRDARIQWLLRQLTGAEAATVVNNNAAATWIVLNAVAAGREVIVSRGQLVEIGGSFRLPDVMAASGAKLVEVGTTNKTHARDYEQAISDNTAAILRVHPSNYQIVGFTAEVPLAELVAIAHKRGLVLIDDVGAGALLDLSPLGLDAGPTLADSIRTGADLITSSTDKLIGGPQGGLILGKAQWVERVRRSPLARIVRAGKLALAALEATLTLFLDRSRAAAEVPTLAMLARPLSELAERARRIADAIRERTAAAEVSVVEGASQMGGGSLPGQDLPTRLVAIRPLHTSPDVLAARLRQNRPPVLTRIKNDRVLADPRTLLDGEDELLVEALARVLAEGG
ncbi:MAG: L-seryl-tRNA(Sec) selenium transferase, partial [Thermoguttaceae bacterium]